jgi:crotonobetainyl-CoA:carnitine CoA-transferase CaiB-like acyl-CoA transferase
VFATNLSRTALRNHGIDHAALAAACPRLVYFYGAALDDPLADDRIRGEHAAYYLKSASSVFFATEKAPLPELPPQLGELLCAVFSYASISSALFHLIRSGEGACAE